jgi:hypothetical protein
MPLHLLKLCVGAESIDDLEGWIAERLQAQRAAGETAEQKHTTRMVPTRTAELLDGGSLYWVIKGHIAARQELVAIRPFTDEGGIGRCHLVLVPSVIPVDPRPCRPFQGWRYLPHDIVPPDLGVMGRDVMGLPEPLRRELRLLGLL